VIFIVLLLYFGSNSQYAPEIGHDLQPCRIAGTVGHDGELAAWVFVVARSVPVNDPRAGMKGNFVIIISFASRVWRAPAPAGTEALSVRIDRARRTRVHERSNWDGPSQYGLFRASSDASVHV